MPRSAAALALEEADQQQLRQWASAFGTPQQVALRSQIVVLLDAGSSLRSVLILAWHGLWSSAHLSFSAANKRIFLRVIMV
jgi:hypothetical protein